MITENRTVFHIVAALLVLTLVPASFAAKGGGGSTGGKSTADSLTLIVPGSTTTGGAAAAAQPQWGQQVTFDVVTNASWSSVQVECAQNGAAIYRQSVPYPFGSLMFTLSGYWWTGGAADCTATLSAPASSGKWTTLATTAFHVNP
jgi:hypothetical protein